MAQATLDAARVNEFIADPRLTRDVPTPSLQSAADCVPQNDYPITEALLLDQLEIQAHTIGEKPLSAANDRWADNHLELVDKTRAYRLHGEFWTVHRDVVLSVGLEPPDRRDEFALDPRPALRGSASSQ